MRSRVEELRAAAPIRARGLCMREGERVLLCGTIGAEFDLWQRRLAATSAADAFLAQQIGLDEVEREMDRLELKAASELLRDGERLEPRRSPGYGEMPLEMSHEIVMKLDAAKKIGVSVTESALLVPTKSVTAICRVVRNVV